jgi:hypothetical protein
MQPAWVSLEGGTNGNNNECVVKLLYRAYYVPSTVVVTLHSLINIWYFNLHNNPVE